jgi:hypothetical protein
MTTRPGPPDEGRRVTVTWGAADGHEATVIETSGRNSVRIRFDELVAGLIPGDPWYRRDEVRFHDEAVANAPL